MKHIILFRKAKEKFDFYEVDQRMTMFFYISHLQLWSWLEPWSSDWGTVDDSLFMIEFDAVFSYSAVDVWGS